MKVILHEQTCHGAVVSQAADRAVGDPEEPGTASSTRPPPLQQPVVSGALPAAAGGGVTAVAETATLTAAALLVGCGGSNEAPPAAFFQTEQAPTRRVLGVGQSAALPAPTVTELLDWAEQAYAEYFPGPASDQVLAPYVYRFYPATDNYVGVAGSDVYVLGPVSGGQLLRVGTLADFAPMVLATRWAFSDEQAARFLQQAQFSSTLAEIAEVRALGYPVWLEARFGTAGSGTSSWDWLMTKGFGATATPYFFEGQSYGAYFSTWYSLFAAPDAMRQRCALALSELFVISTPSFDGFPWKAFLVAAFWDLLVRHAFGNFRDLLEAVTLSPAMGYFLNTAGNEKADPVTGRRPDENYAREVMQLFTIGLHRLRPDGTPELDAQGQPVPSFVDGDVGELAKVFTGYDVDSSVGTLLDVYGNQQPHKDYARRPMRLNPALHSPEAKAFLGVRIAAGTPGSEALKTALDTLFQHPNVGPFVGRQMIQRLVTSNPSPAYVARVAAAFADNGAGVRGDMRALWRAILLDDEARSPAGLADPGFGKLREPMVRFAQWGRTFGVKSRFGYWKYVFNPYNAEQELPQQPLHAPSVFNFFRPGYVPPGTTLASRGATVPELQITNESTVSAYVNALCAYIFNGIYTDTPDVPQTGDLATPTAAAGVDIDVDYAAEMVLVPDFRALVQRLNLLMCANQMAADVVDLIAEACEDLWRGVRFDPEPGNRRRMVAYALLYVMSSPDYVVQR